MSYCRFEGTYAELRACISEVEDHVNEEAEYEVSDREIRQFREMVEYFHSFLCDNELLDEFGDLDTVQLDKVCEAMSKSYTGDDTE
jgi:hypothetical protein